MKHRHIPLLPRPKPVVDMAKVNEGLALVVGHHVGPKTEYDKSINYVTAANGLFEVRESDLCRVISKEPKKVMGVAESMTEGIVLKTPKIPFEFLSQTVAFFRGAYEKMKGSTEAFVQIWWSWKDEKYVMHVPEQTVSSGSVRHESKFGQGDDAVDWMHVMDIHSHGDMSGFFSGVDDADERRVNGERFSGVIGKVQQPLPDWSFRLITRGQFVPVPVTMLFDCTNLTIPFVVDGDVLFKSAADSANVTNGHVRLSCPVDPFHDATFPAEWLDQLKGYAASPTHNWQNQGRGVPGFRHGSSDGNTETTGNNRSRGSSYNYPSQHQVPMGQRRFVYIGREELEVMSDGTMRRTGFNIEVEK